MLKVLETMIRSLINLDGHLSGILKLSSKAAEVARLLALEDVSGVEGMKKEANAKKEKENEARVTTAAAEAIKKEAEAVLWRRQ